MHNRLTTVVALVIAGTALAAQTPRPFPAPGAAEGRGATSVGQPQVSASAPQAAQPGPDAAAAATDPNVPTEATLGLPVYPGATYLASYDAGRGQRYYIFGTGTPYADIVTYYRTQLRGRGTEVFEEPPTHMWEVGRFRNETMAFPPGVTVKDYTWGGSMGYPNPVPGAEPARYPTIIMVVPAPADAAAR